MFAQVKKYFSSGRKICLVGAFALGNERDRFASRVRRYFADWDSALAAALVRGGKNPDAARELSREVLGGIQGALVLARGMDQPRLFTKALDRLHAQLKS